LTIQVTNDFAKWEIFYKIINYCNSVLTYAPGIREIDPNYTEGWLQVHLAEAYTIRALTYFYLVRIYGDVPFVVRPYADDTENFNIGFSSEDEILNTLIADLKISEQYAVISRGNATPSDRILTKGRVTKNAVRALMADIYLWLASGHASNPALQALEYGEAIAACDRILEWEIDEDKVIDKESLTGAELYFVSNKNASNGSPNLTSVFCLGNSRESIFELQFDALNHNKKLVEFYGKGVSSTEKVRAASYLNDNAEIFPANDFRKKDSFQQTTSKTYRIFKYVGERRSQPNSEATSSYVYSGSDYPNWILYRLSDAYLMKAEALVEKPGATEDELREALRLVNLTYEHSNPEAELLLWDNYKNNIQDMKDLVLLERQREFLFEGKRWFDLLRLVRREGNSDRMINLYMIRNHTYSPALPVKLSIRAALYMPIHQNEVMSNAILYETLKKKQEQGNPFYIYNFE
ncbi:MAG: RagB/SusD family nutrient uptake outer membrane protein, partial [Dysgonamonadaceae bacterium]|nr:RagB/SusD family nutrient uptake outer membrane protein [Dysgonamonadaceae bacterium]